MVTVTPQLWFQPAVNQQSLSKYSVHILHGFKPNLYAHALTLNQTNNIKCSNFQIKNSPDGRAFGGQKLAAGRGGCQRCGFPVYEAEKMISKNRSWHKRCFSCSACHKSLDSTNLCDGPDNEIYCRGCYGRQFGPKGVGFGLGAGCLSMSV